MNIFEDHFKSQMELLSVPVLEKVKVNKPLPKEGKFSVIYADPPWAYNEIGVTAAAENHYQTMSSADICSMPIRELSDTNSVLFLWATSPLLPEALEVMKSWGFKYKASIIWDKDAHVMGHYTAVNHELLVIGTRGRYQPEYDKLFPSIVKIKRTVHSRKPDEFRRMIEVLYPSGKKLELFARKAVDGWESFGNEVEI